MVVSGNAEIIPTTVLSLTSSYMKQCTTLI